MSYRCGIGGGMERFGLTPGPPHIRCDGCGITLEARTKSGGPPAWLLNGKAPRGWKCVRDAEHYTRQDWCPRCKENVT